ncbi:hypothetical protein AB0H36_27545 [Kribbella sp. NPDC050820]|uniref:hypothetical protein n=1 Tax=Kribbella sp. NPDC050820 TaxID=3155408 RepID=UPI0033D97357
MKHLDEIEAGTLVRHVDQAEGSPEILGRVTIRRVDLEEPGRVAVCIETSPGHLLALPASTLVETLSLWRLSRVVDVIEPREMLACVVAAFTEDEACLVAAAEALGEGAVSWQTRFSFLTVELIGDAGGVVREPGMVLADVVVAD